MTDHRFIIEMGMGNDQYGMNYQKAAARAIESAIRRSAIPMYATTELEPSQMRVEVSIGVQEPDKIDTAALAACLPRGQANVTAVFGGHNVVNPDTGDTIVIATAAVEAFLPDQSEHYR